MVENYRKNLELLFRAGGRVYRRANAPGSNSFLPAAADLRAVSGWIQLNEAAIAAFGESRISGVEFGRRLRKLP